MATTVTLVVMERGSEWPGHIGGSENLVVLAQDGGDLLPSLQQRLAAFARQGQLVKVGVLACNNEASRDACEARSRLAFALMGAISAMPSRGAGRLVFTVGEAGAPRLRYSVLELANTLRNSPRGVHANIFVRFRSGRSEDVKHEVGAAELPSMMQRR